MASYNGFYLPPPSQSMYNTQQYPQQGPAYTMPGQQTLDPSTMPYFRDNLLVFPAAGVGLHARPSGRDEEPRHGNRNLGPVMDDFKKLKQEAKEQMESLNKLAEKAGLGSRSMEETRMQEERDSLESKWFTLPENTYGAGIWAILVLEMEASKLWNLMPVRAADWIPVNQHWNEQERFAFFWDMYYWLSLRVFPFFRATFFQFTAVFLTGVSWVLQFGFTLWLDRKLGGFDFLDSENAEYVCATSGWVQLISVGFFLAFMIGQFPTLAKNVMIILTSKKETDESRGEKGARCWES